MQHLRGCQIHMPLALHAAVPSYLRRLAMALNVALNMSPNAPSGGTVTHQQRVYAVALVAAKPLYGYQAEDSIWVKIML
jgi:hypothetical protein